MDARLVQCVSIAGFIEDVRFGLGKIDDDRYRLTNQPLNFIDDAALKLPPIDSFAHRSHLLRGLATLAILGLALLGPEGAKRLLEGYNAVTR